ncbi:MAG: DUF4276 family protein [Anaerolineae bacterium]|jgi:hypothetical protein|nr:DUF4276 family protein [Anaerolineae bacterium]
MRLVILVEGHVEYRVLKELQFLKPFTTEFKKVEVLNLEGNGNLIKRFKQVIEDEIENEPDIFVLILIDLLEAPFKPYPKAIERAVNPNRARYSYIQKYMRDQIDLSVREKVYVIPVVWEIETWLLADREALANDLKWKECSYPDPEAIEKPTDELNTQFKRLKGLAYHKIKDGVRLFGQADPRRIYDDNCPHFRELVDVLRKAQGIVADAVDLPKSKFDLSVYQKLAKLEDERQRLLDQLTDENLEQTDERIEMIERQMQQLLESLIRDLNV